MDAILEDASRLVLNNNWQNLYCTFPSCDYVENLQSCKFNELKNVISISSIIKKVLQRFQKSYTHQKSND